MRKTGRGGRPSKGVRDLLATRTHPELGELVRTEAELRGMTISDYLAALIAAEVGRPELAPPMPAVSGQGSLLDTKEVMPAKTA